MNDRYLARPFCLQPRSVPRERARAKSVTGGFPVPFLVTVNMPIFSLLDAARFSRPRTIDRSVRREIIIQLRQERKGFEADASGDSVSKSETTLAR